MGLPSGILSVAFLPMMAVAGLSANQATSPAAHGSAHQVQHHAPKQHRPARHRPRPRRHAHHGNYLVYDSVTPSAIPSHHRQATYATGPYSHSASEVPHNTLWIDTNTSDPHANALDVEPGDATPSQASHWVYQKLHGHGGVAVLYSNMSQWPAVKASVHTLPQSIQHRVRYWIADPNGTPHIVPGASATQWYWGTSYDISTFKSGF